MKRKEDTRIAKKLSKVEEGLKAVMQDIKEIINWEKTKIKNKWKKFVIIFLQKPCTQPFIINS